MNCQLSARALLSQRMSEFVAVVERHAHVRLAPQVPLPDGVKAVSVAAGRQHALVATSEGAVYSWGGSALVAGRQGPLGAPGLVAGALKGAPHTRTASIKRWLRMCRFASGALGWPAGPSGSSSAGDGRPQDG